MASSDPSRRQILNSFFVAVIGWLWPRKARASKPPVVEKSPAQLAPWECTITDSGCITTFTYDAKAAPNWQVSGTITTFVYDRFTPGISPDTERS
jgi:hypothetical protein